MLPVVLLQVAGRSSRRSRVGVRLLCSLLLLPFTSCAGSCGAAEPSMRATRCGRLRLWTRWCLHPNTRARETTREEEQPEGASLRGTSDGGTHSPASPLLSCYFPAVPGQPCHFPPTWLLVSSLECVPSQRRCSSSFTRRPDSSQKDRKSHRFENGQM